MDLKLGLGKPKLFPHVLLRLATGKLDSFPQGDERMIAKARALEAIDQELALLRMAVCDELYTLIPAYERDACFQALIQLKRDIFNARYLLDAQRNLLLGLPERIKTAVTQLDERMETRDVLYRDYCAAYSDVVVDFETALQHLTQHPGFQKALLLSSEVLLSRMLDASKQGYSASGKGQQKRLFFSLLRYLSRMYFKSSPFSLFTAIGILPLRDAPKEPFVLTATDRPVQSCVRVNDALLEVIRQLLHTQTDVMNNMLLGINRTVRISGGYLRFVVLSQQVELIRQMKYTPLLAKVLACLEVAVTRADLHQALAAELDDVADKQLHDFLETLLANGLIQYVWKTGKNADAWPEDLAVCLRALPEKTIATEAMLSFLTCLSAAAEAYVKVEVMQRRALLAACTATWKEVMAAFGDASQPYRNWQPAFLYEDATTTVDGTLDKQGASNLAMLIEELAVFLQPIDALFPERERIKAHFKKLMGADMSFEMELLRFYQSYRQFFPLDRKMAEGGDDFSAAYQLHYRAMLDRIKELPSFRTLQKGQHTVHIARGEWEMTAMATRGLRSRAAFLQTFVDRERGVLAGVLNAAFQGMGKGYGRFLPFLDRQLMDDLRLYNTQALSDELGMDLCDASLFNANRHPALLDYVLGWDAEQHAYAQEQEISVNDLLLCWDANAEQPQLVQRHTRKRICPFDLSLQALNRRAGLYQFLVHFSSEQGLSFRPFALALDELLEHCYGVDTPVRLLPRIVYADVLVIRRRAWLVVVDVLPKRQQGESDEALFLRFSHFFDIWEMPQRFFLKLKPRKPGAPLGDEYKPQYMDRYLPPFVLLLERLLPKADKHIYFEEFLPDAVEDKSSRVTELLMQWYN